jgi:hypothetical protein
LEKIAILDFVGQMKTKDHVILFYSDPEGKHQILFTHLKAGLENGEATAYVAGDETPNEIRKTMKRFGINVDRLEQEGALRIIDYNEWFIIGGKFDLVRTMSLLMELHEEVRAKGFRGLRFTGEMACFFKHGLVKDLVEYEESLHRVLEIPIAVICAYNYGMVVKYGNGELYLDLIKAHGTVIFADSKGGVIKSY